jgi:outer membrane receptor protein involved in Fe transport
MSKNKQPARSFRRKSCVVAVEIAISLMAAPLVFAQQAEKVEKIEITGTRLPSPTLEGPSPVSVISAADIQLSGSRNVENMLNNLPQVFADQNSTVANGASGTATVNLRGLGVTRTLVLMNGRRLPYGDITYGGGSAADLNMIPTSLIKRVEILTGGAGAVYGSDAVAGVVNFIMNDKFQGVQIDVNQSGYNHSQQNTRGIADIVNGRAASNPSQFQVPGDKSFDGRTFDLALTMGSNFDGGKGNATMFFAYKKQDALLQSERDFSACSVAGGAAFTCGGSGTNATGRITNLNAPGGIWTNADSNGTARRFNNALDQYNFGPLNHYQRPDERYNAAAFANYDVSPNAKVYMEFNFGDDLTPAQIAPGGVFGNVETVNFDNPLLSASWRTALGLLKPGDSTDIVLQRRNVEGGGRISEFRHTTFREVVGVKGEIAKWSYDVYAENAKMIFQQAQKNYFLNDRIDRAMNVVNQNGTAVCQSVVDGTDPNCVPYNPWKLGAVTAAQLAYLQVGGFEKGSAQQSVYGGSVSSDLGDYGVKFPAAKSGVAVAFGYERRTEKIDLDTDVVVSTGSLSGSGGPTPPISGKYTVNDYFAEVRAPLVEGAPMADLISVNGSFRRSSYSTNVDTNTYGIGADWAPNKLFRLRGSYQDAVRAANLVELFQAQGNNLFDGTDPCAGPTPTASAAQCARTGVTAAQYGNIQLSPAGQYNYLQGGNPGLQPEKAKTYTVGFVLTPMKNFSATLDYFDIKVDKIINKVDPTTTLNQCLTNGSFCNLVQRDRLGTLWLLDNGRIIATNQNLGSTATSGFDVSANYDHTLPEKWGKLNLNYVGTYLRKLETEEIPGLGKYDCVGYYGSSKCGGPNPEWRHHLRATWMTPWDVNLLVGYRFADAVKIQESSSQTLLAGAFPATDERLHSANYIDIAGTWMVTKQFTLLGGINNLFDRDPPITSSQGPSVFGNGNTFPGSYDTLGRKIFVSGTYKF